MEVAFGQDTHAPTELPEVDFSIMVLVYYLHGLLDGFGIDSLLESTQVWGNGEYKV